MSTPHAIIGDNDAGKTTTADNYYVAALSGVEEPLATAVTEAEFKSNDMIEKLNKNLDATVFVADSKNKNGGFPAFAWEQSEVTGIAAAQIQANIELNGRNISSSQLLTIYDLSGRVVVKGNNVTLPDGGIYLISAPQQPTMKVLVK